MNKNARMKEKNAQIEPWATGFVHFHKPLVFFEFGEEMG